MASGMTFVAPVLGTPASGNLANCTFPTLNQNTTGTAGGLTGTPNISITNLTVSGTITFPSQTANTFHAAPNGSAGAPTFRAIVAADIPTLNQNTTGTSGGLTGTPAITVGAIGCTAITGTGAFQAKRFNAHGGTVPTSTSFTLSSGWGTSPTLTIVEGTDQACYITIVAKATVGASPTVTYTFKDGTWTQVPIIVCCRADVVAAAAAPGATVTNQWVVTSISATAVTFTFNGTPVANNTYGLAWIAMGT
jgi:hypothetical protein